MASAVQSWRPRTPLSGDPRPSSDRRRAIRLTDFCLLDFYQRALVPRRLPIPLGESVGRLLHGQTTGFGGPSRRVAGPLTPTCSRRRSRPRLAPRERDPTAKALGCPRPTGTSAPRCPFEHPARAAPVGRLGRRRLRLSKPLPAGMPEGRPWADRRPRPCPVPEGKRASLGLGLTYRSLAAVATHERSCERDRCRHPGHRCRALRALGGSPLSSPVEIRSPLPPRERRERRVGSRCQPSGRDPYTNEELALLVRARAEGPSRRLRRDIARVPTSPLLPHRAARPDEASNRCGSTAAGSGWPKPA